MATILPPRATKATTDTAGDEPDSAIRTPDPQAGPSVWPGRSWPADEAPAPGPARPAARRTGREEFVVARLRASDLRHPIESVRSALAAARADDLFLYAAALAFYGLVSVAPLVVVALWLTSLLVGSDQVEDAANALARYAPEALGADRALVRVADFGTRLGVLAVIAALWPATAYGAGLMRILDRFGDDRAATGMRRRGAALLLVAMAPALLLAGLIASYAGAATLGDSPLGVALGFGLALVYGFAAAAATVVFIYRVFPRTPGDWRSTARGAVVGAGSVSLLSAAYVAYLRFGARFEQRYVSDALAAVVLLGVWLYAANLALLVGYRTTRKAISRRERAGVGPADAA